MRGTVQHVAIAARNRKITTSAYENSEINKKSPSNIVTLTGSKQTSAGASGLLRQGVDIAFRSCCGAEEEDSSAGFCKKRSENIEMVTTQALVTLKKTSKSVDAKRPLASDTPTL